MFFFSRFVWLPLFFPCILSSIISLRFDMLMIRKASRFTHEILFCSASFSSPPPQPSPCLFVCLPFFVYSIRIPAGYTTSLGVCVCMCFFSSLLLLLYPFVLWANFHKLFVVRRCGILFIDERRWGWAKLYTVHQQQPSKFSPEKKKIICQMRRRESSILQNLI